MAFLDLLMDCRFHHTNIQKNEIKYSSPYVPIIFSGAARMPSHLFYSHPFIFPILMPTLIQGNTQLTVLELALSLELSQYLSLSLSLSLHIVRRNVDTSLSDLPS